MQKQTFNDSTKALVLLSGGQDSTTCLFWALEKFDHVDAIAFYYGQKHSRELRAASEVAKIAGADLQVLDVSNLLADSSLTKNTSHNKKSHINEELPASFTAGRNLLFLTVAASRAAEKGINDLVTGVCQTDYSGYPDCRRHTIDAMQTTLSLGMGAGDFRIHTPLMYLTKAETWKLGKDLNILDIIIEKTVTDYNGDETMNAWGMGKENNPASILRAKGYQEALQNGWL